MELTDDTVLGLPAHVLHRNVEGETVLLNLEDEGYYGLDAVGTAFLELITESNTFGSAVASLLERFEVSEQDLRADLAALVDELVETGLVHVEAT